MDYVTLGSTGITVNKNGFGAIPIQRLSDEDAAFILTKAYLENIRFFDTARSYSDSEKKIGAALSAVRSDIFISTKTGARTPQAFKSDLETSLSLLNTDYIDIYQFHNPPFCPKPNDGSGLYEAMEEAKDSGKIRHIGFTNHRLEIATEAAQSGLYETIQYPLSYLSSTLELDFISLCADRNIGILAMKALAGGLITNSAAAYAFLSQYDNVLPIWGIYKINELDEFLSYHDNPPDIMSDDIARVIAKDITELSGDFCRGCGYCLPCPADIEIPTSARISLLLRRALAASWLTDEWQEKMDRINNCIECGHCKDNCPYGLDVPNLLKENLADFLSFL